MAPERRYTDQEFARIMEAATAVRPALPAPGSRPQHRLTLSELQAIAAEVGVSPEAVARIARTLPLRPETDAARLVGGPATIQLEFTLPGEAGDAEANRVLEALRRVTLQQGAARRTGTVLEWTNEWPGSVAVNVTAADGETRVMILSDRRNAAGGIAAVAVAGAGITFGISGAILEPTGAVAIGALGLAIGGTAAVVARTIWARSTRRCRALLARLTAAVTDALGSETPRA